MYFNNFNKFYKVHIEMQVNAIGNIFHEFTIFKKDPEVNFFL